MASCILIHGAFLIKGLAMGYVVPTVADFKARFVRDFPFGTDVESTVIDGDITLAITDSTYVINESLFDNQAEFASAFLLLAAHNLVMNLRASSQGLSGQFAWITGSKGVGSVSESYNVPTQIMENPYLAVFSKTNYGVAYVMRILPLLSGNIFVAGGGTTA